MSRRRSTRRKTWQPQHIRLYAYVTSCPAWAALTSDARSILIDLWSRHNGVNNGQIHYAVRDGSRLGIGRNRCARALNQLVEMGFLFVTQNSTFDQKKLAREFRLSAEPVENAEASKEFMSWGKKKPVPQARLLAHSSHVNETGGEAISSPNAHTAPLTGLSEQKSNAHSRDGGTLIVIPGGVAKI